jgi:uncharacterized membrane protein YfcA
VEFSTIVLISFVVLLTGISKSAFSGAFGIFAVPLLMLELSATHAVALMLPILVIADAMSISSFWRKWDVALLSKLIPGAIVGILIAVFLLEKLNANFIGLFIASICVLFSLKNLYFKQVKIKFLKGNKGAYLMSSLSGITSTLVHAGGPPLIMYFSAIDLSPKKFVATTAAFFAITNISKLVGTVVLGLLTFDVLLLALSFIPVALVGNWLGVKLHHKLKKDKFLRIMNCLLLVLGLWLGFNHIKALVI